MIWERINKAESPGEAANVKESRGWEVERNGTHRRSKSNTLFRWGLGICKDVGGLHSLLYIVYTGIFKFGCVYL